jgi:hypothetical protein
LMFDWLNEGKKIKDAGFGECMKLFILQKNKSEAHWSKSRLGKMWKLAESFKCSKWGTKMADVLPNKD